MNDGPAGVVKVVYADLDGTILGPGGSLFRAHDGLPTLRAAQALRELHHADVGIVLMSGRTRRGLHEPARILGARAYIAEMGAVLVEEDPAGEVVVPNFGAYAGDGTPRDEMLRSGVGGFLLERFPGSLHPVAPAPESTSLMFHGLVPVVQANEALHQAGHGWLRLHDNGRLRRTYPGLDVPHVHAYHLLPQGVGKASAVRLHRHRNGIAAAEAVAVGDSASDLAVAPEVGAFFLVANGMESLGEATLPDNAHVTDAPGGEGFAQVVTAVLGSAPPAPPS